MESMRETVSRMRNELMSLKMENEKLQAIVVQKSASTSSMSPTGAIGDVDTEGDRRPLSTMSDNR